VNNAPRNYDFGQILPHIGFKIEGDPFSKKKADQVMVTRTQAASTDFKLSYSSGVVDAHLS